MDHCLASNRVRVLALFSAIKKALSRSRDIQVVQARPHELPVRSQQVWRPGYFIVTNVAIYAVALTAIMVYNVIRRDSYIEARKNNPNGPVYTLKSQPLRTALEIYKNTT